MSKVNLGQKINTFLGSRQILVVEPSSAYRASLRNFFNALRVKNVKLVLSIEEAERQMRVDEIGFFVVEWQLTQRNGLEFCRDLRKKSEYKLTPFLLMTSESLRHDVVLASEGGVDCYLVKPFSFEDFSRQLNSLVTYAKNPSNLHSILERAEEHLEAGKLWIAESFFFEAQNIKSNSARAMCGLGRVDLRSGNYSGARDKFRAAMVMNPDYVDTYKYLFDLAEQMDDHASLLDSAKQLHQLSPENPRYTLIVANLLLNSGDVDGSENFFKITIKLSPKMASAHRGLGHVYLQKRDYDNAQKSLEKALDLESHDISTLNSLGLTYVKMQLIDRGIEKYRMALSINPRDARVLFNLALAFEEKGEETSMRESLLRATAVDPSFEKAKRKLANIGSLTIKDEPSRFLIQSDDDDLLTENQKKGA